MIAVVKTGGKQYTLSEDSTVRIEKKMGDVGTDITFEEVLLVSDEKGTKLKVGSPFIDGATVTGKIIKQGRANKVKVVKYKNKIRYKRNIGHRQYFTEVKVEKIKA
ncbi:MAG: 50S ribosomal protein L21 [bacterium]|nr:50S ribosomal protein L21 [bacterium]